MDVRLAAWTLYYKATFLLVVIISYQLVAASGYHSYQQHEKRHHQYSHSRRHHQARSIVDCTMDTDVICNTPEGKICRNKTCISACSVKGLQKCNCPIEDDNYCYLCCGNDNKSCRPAHKYNIFKPNGEKWERDTCANCVNNINGLSCDNRDKRRVCYNGQCAATVCHGLSEGEYCDMHKYKICTDGECRNPCREYRSTLLTCDCDSHSEDRCQLCCFDPRTKRCDNAFRKYGLANKDGRPIYRHGLPCRRGLSCNKYGTCAGAVVSFSLLALLFNCLLISYQYFLNISCYLTFLTF